MEDIFISYSREDAQLAASLARGLKAEGYASWWDTTVLPGESFSDMIKDHEQGRDQGEGQADRQGSRAIAFRAHCSDAGHANARGGACSYRAAKAGIRGILVILGCGRTRNTGTLAHHRQAR